MSKKEEESELVGGRTFSFLTHLESKRPAEEYSPVTILPPNLWIALLFNEEVNENEESLTKVQLFISKMENMKPSAKEKQNMVESVFDDNVQTSSIKETFVNPLILKAFDDLNDKIRFQIEIESKLCKSAIDMKIKFLEVVGNAMVENITGYYGDMEKLFKGL
uniref:Uncharacterized protein n=1 Tax=Rhizophagus irregularis (strain DAOM 181602 / DAOM 197198 / MUCL 43194) TaxID=747089 RepID=U9T3A5_RHIID